MLSLTVLMLPALAAAVMVDQHIVGGGEANINQYRYQGSYRTNTGGHTCGCVLVADQIALTAAHCGGGSTYTTEWGNSARGTGPYVGINSVVRHPDYSKPQTPGAYPNDIAIIYLSSSAVANGGAVTNMGSNAISSGNSAISGWGRTCGSCALPVNLHAVSISVLNDAECSAQWGINYNGDVHVCVWDSNRQDKGSCNGDSGGPMVTNALHGITSWGVSGCSPTYPSVYTRVTTFRPWVCAETGNAAGGC